MRSPGGEDVEAILVLRTLGAPQRRLLRRRRGSSVNSVEPEPVATARATFIRPEPFASPEEAERWLGELRGDRDAASEELSAALRLLNRALHAQRVAWADPGVGDASAERALVVRIGYGRGDELAEGRFESGWELPRPRPRTRRSMQAPEERFAAVLGARRPALACEELVLRARADLEAGREREAALQARIALEALFAELGQRQQAEARGALEADRGPVGRAANAALAGPIAPELAEAVSACVGRMEAALRRHRARG